MGDDNDDWHAVKSFDFNRKIAQIDFVEVHVPLYRDVNNTLLPT